MKCAYCKDELPGGGVPGPYQSFKSKKRPFFCDEDCRDLWVRETRETPAKGVFAEPWIRRAEMDVERRDAKYHGRGYEGGSMEGRAPNDRPGKDWDPNTIILKTLAIDNHGHEYHVALEREPGKWNPGNEWILVVGHTGGRWFMSTLMESGRLHNEIWIDHGQGWKVINFRDVFEEALKVVQG